MILTSEKLMERLREKIGEGTDDETLSFWEDINDTLTDYETRANGDGRDWKKAYEENDRIWRERYRDRFFGREIPDDGMEDIGSPDGRDDKEPPKPTKYEELFVTEEK